MYFSTHSITYPHTYLRTGIAQSLLRLATGRTVQGLNSGKEKIFLSSSFPSRPALYSGHRDSFPGVKRPGCCVAYPLQPAVRLKKQQSYTSIPPSVPPQTRHGATIILLKYLSIYFNKQQIYLLERWLFIFNDEYVIMIILNV
jgi:hypothetical protein